MLNPSSSLHVSLVFHISWLVNPEFCCQCFSWGCCAERNSILWYLQCISVYYWHKVHPLFKHAEWLPLGIKIQPVSLNNGWNTKVVASASHYPCPIVQAAIWQGPMQIWCVLSYLDPREPASLMAELCASTVQGRRHQNGETLLSLLFSSLLGFWPLKLVCLGELLHIMLLSRLCDCSKCLWVTNVWQSSESFSPWEWTMCAVHSQAPIRGADICVWG